MGGWGTQENSKPLQQSGNRGGRGSMKALFIERKGETFITRPGCEAGKRVKKGDKRSKDISP